jgi:hypothetical protein
LKQFDNLTLQQGSHARMQFDILPLQQGNSRRVHAVWYPTTAAGQQPPRACSLVFTGKGLNAFSVLFKSSNCIAAV